MYHSLKTFPQWGRVLWLTDAHTEIGIALDFGIRVVHLSCAGLENLYYEQPTDLSDGFTTAGGWRLYGGHRLWLAPEGDNAYYPDNAPVHYSLEENGVLIEQDTDPFLQVRKSMRITFLEDGGVRVAQRILNVSERPMTGAAWGVNTLDAGGEAEISFGHAGRGGYTPRRVVSLWSDTNLHDPRLAFGKDRLLARHLPMKDYLKIGLYSNPGKAVFVNKGQRFTLLFDAQPLESYPDNGCNFELYMCKQFMELESLGVKTELLPGQCAVHVETWYVENCD